MMVDGVRVQSFGVEDVYVDLCIVRQLEDVGMLCRNNSYISIPLILSNLFRAHRNVW